MSDEQEKTHVLMQDCIISEIGRCEAGMSLSESDVVPSTWSWLQDRGFVKSIDEIEREADNNDDTPDGVDETPESKPATGRRRK